MSIELAKQELKVLQGNYSFEQVECNATEEALLGLVKKYFSGDANAVFWHMQKVAWGIFQNGSVRFPEGEDLSADTILEARFFDEEAELHVIRCEESFSGRYVKDEGAQKIKYVDSLARLWGEKDEVHEGFVTLKDEQRKLKMVIPCGEEAVYYGLVTRNYIGYAQRNGQAGYIDSRFVKITSAEGRE